MTKSKSNKATVAAAEVTSTAVAAQVAPLSLMESLGIRNEVTTQDVVSFMATVRVEDLHQKKAGFDKEIKDLEKLSATRESDKNKAEAEVLKLVRAHAETLVPFNLAGITNLLAAFQVLYPKALVKDDVSVKAIKERVHATGLDTKYEASRSFRFFQDKDEDSAMFVHFVGRETFEALDLPAVQAAYTLIAPIEAEIKELRVQRNELGAMSRDTHLEILNSDRITQRARASLTADALSATPEGRTMLESLRNRAVSGNLLG